MPEVTKKCVVGVDLGGTKILAGVFDSALHCQGRNKRTTKAHKGPDVVVQRVARCVVDALEEADIAQGDCQGVGIGAPGAVDPESGNVIFAPNLDWRNYPLKKSLEQQLGMTVYVGNDCNVCTLGVFEAELKGKPKTLLGIFVGTGIGGGLMIDGQLYTGFNQTAGEVGHMVIDVNGPKCGCGNRGCFEALASRTSIFRKITNAVEEGGETVLLDLLDGDLSAMRSSHLRKAMRKGDKLVKKTIEEAAGYTGIAVANLINAFNPQVVVLGGGVIEQIADDMMPTIVATAKKHVMSGTFEGIEILASRLGDDAGITGAAVLARRAGR